MLKILRITFVVFCLTALSCSSALAQTGDILSWIDCLREASQNHPDLISAYEGVVQSEQAKKVIAANALLDVSANLSASTVNTDSGFNKNFSYGISASQLLFDGKKTFNNIHSADENIKASQFSFKFTSSEIRLRLRQAFVALLKAQELISLTQEIYNLRRSNLELITLRYESGTEHKGALLTAKANISQAAFEISSAKRGLESAQRELLKEMGRGKFVPVSVTADFSVVSFDPVEPAFEVLADKIPSVLHLIAQKNATAFDVKSSRGEFWPAVFLNGEASKSDHQWPPKDESTSAGIGVSLPLFAGGANTARLAQARSVYRQLEQEARSARDRAIVDLQNNWNGFADAVEKVQVQKDFLAAAEERAKIAQAQYSIGLITFDNWTIIEDDVVSSRKIFLDVQASALVAEANWIQAKGETLEYEK